jgi:CubicO group peptidase (beta-lactamase class C family)
MKIKNSFFTLAAILSTVISAQNIHGALERVTPESQGIPSEAVLDLIDKLEEQNGDVHSYMLIRNGKVVAEGHWAPFAAQLPHTLYSVSKAFVSMAIGMAIEDGLLALDDKVVKFYPEAAGDNIDERLKEMRIRDLMSMKSGQQKDTFSLLRNAMPGEEAKAFFSMPMRDEPGRLFRYMSGNTAMLALIHAKVTGEKDLIAYLNPRLFNKLGIKASYWPRLKNGTVIGGSGFQLCTEDLAKVCILLENEGVWNGERILPLWWIKQATSLQAKYGNITDSVLALHGSKDQSVEKPDDWQVGYGWQLWMGHHDSFRLCGAFGQIGSIIPDKNLIFVSNAGGRGSNKPSLNAFYDAILPALSQTPLKENPTQLKRLRERSKNLLIAPPKSSARMSDEAASAFKSVKIDSTNALFLTAAGYDCKTRTLTIENRFAKQSISVGENSWERSEIVVEEENTETLSRISGGRQPVAAAGAWTTPNTFTVRIHFVQSPAILFITFELRDGKVHFSTKSNMSKRYSMNIQQ